MEYFLGYGPFTGSYRQHNAALKFFRDEHEHRILPFESAPALFSNTQTDAVASVVWGRGQAWGWNRECMVQWSWKEMIAQLDEASMRVAVQGTEGRSRGLVGCYLAPRVGSYDHKRHDLLMQAGRPMERVQLPVWDFVFERDDGTALRLHPQRSTTQVETYEVEGHAQPVQVPRRGLGTSDGRGTYRRYVREHTRASLKFDARKGSNLQPFKVQG